MVSRFAGQNAWILTAGVLVMLITAALGAYLLVASRQTGSQTVHVRTQTSPFLMEYQTPGTEALPNTIAVDSAGNVWTVLQNRTELAEFTPSTSSFRTYPFPEPSGTKVMTWGLAIDDSRHLVWVADETSEVIWSFNMTSLVFKETPIPTVGATPFQLVVDGRGNVWFTEFVGDKLGVISSSGALTELPIPIPGNPTGIAIDSQGKIWFNLLQTSGLAYLYYIGSYHEGSFSFYNLTNRVDTPVGIAVGADGNVWITQHGASLLSEYYPATGQIKTFSTSIPKVGASLPYFVYVDPLSGKVWFNEHYGNAIGEFNPSTGQMVEYRLAPGPSSYGNISGILTMSLATSGTPWFVEVYTGRIGSLNSTAPLDLALELNEQTVSVSNESTTTIHVRITSSVDEPISLVASVGNATNPLSFSFSPASGKGNFTSTMSIEDSSTSKGTYFITISAATKDLTVSQVVEVQSV